MPSCAAFLARGVSPIEHCARMQAHRSPSLDVLATQDGQPLDWVHYGQLGLARRVSPVYQMAASMPGIVFTALH